MEVTFRGFKNSVFHIFKKEEEKKCIDTPDFFLSNTSEV